MSDTINIKKVYDAFKNIDMKKVDEALIGESDTDDFCEHGVIIEFVNSMWNAIKADLKIKNGDTKDE